MEQINNFGKSAMVDFHCHGNKICTIFAKNWLNSVNYKMSSDFSLTRLYFIDVCGRTFYATVP